MKAYYVFFLAAGLGTAVSAQAQSTFDWTFIGTNGVTVFGSGTMTVDTSPTDKISNGGYLVESMAGTFLTQTITELLPVNALYNDNLLSNITGTSEQLDGNGISFNYGSNSEQLWAGGMPDGGYFSNVLGTFSAVPQPTPEPSTIALASLGIAGLMAARYRK